MTIHFCRKLCANARRTDGVVQPVPAGASHKASARNDKWSHLSVWIKNGNMAFFAFFFGDKRRHWHYAIRLLVRNKTYFFRQNEKEANFLSELNTMLRVIRMIHSFQNISFIFAWNKNLLNTSWKRNKKWKFIVWLFSFQSPSMLSLRGPEMEERADRLPPIRQDLVLVTHHIQIHIIIRRGAVIAIYPHTHPRYPLIIRRGTNSSSGAALEASQGVSPGWACQLQRGSSWPSFVICKYINIINCPLQRGGSCHVMVFVF